jgi:hypothetical protein
VKKLGQQTSLKSVNFRPITGEDAERPVVGSFLDGVAAAWFPWCVRENRRQTRPTKRLPGCDCHRLLTMFREVCCPRKKVVVLRRWQIDPFLAGVRDADRLAKLPAA